MESSRTSDEWTIRYMVPMYIYILLVRYIFMCFYICMYIWTYIYIYIYIHTLCGVYIEVA